MLKTTFIISSIVSVFLFSSCKKTKDLEFTPLSKSSAKTEVKLNEGENPNFKYTDFYDDGSEYTDYETDSTSNLRTAAKPKIRVPYAISIKGNDLVYVSPKEGTKIILRSPNGHYSLKIDSKGNLFCYNGKLDISQMKAEGAGRRGININSVDGQPNNDLFASWENNVPDLDIKRYYWYVVPYLSRGVRPYAFYFHKDGNFSLRDYDTFRVLWMMQTTGSPKGGVTLELQNNGNLLLLDVSEKLVWASNAYWEARNY